MSLVCCFQENIMLLAKIFRAIVMFLIILYLKCNPLQLKNAIFSHNLCRRIVFHTPGKLWLKMRRMSIIWLVLHFFGSRLRFTRRKDLLQRALDTPDFVDYFSYPQHGQQVCKNFFRSIWSQKLHLELRKLRNFEMLMRTWKIDYLSRNFFFESL